MEKEYQDIFNEIQDTFGKSKLQPSQYSALALAYIGDAVYDLIIRTIVIDLGVATGFEALVGYWYLTHQMERAMKLLHDGLIEADQMPHK